MPDETPDPTDAAARPRRGLPQVEEPAATADTEPAADPVASTSGAATPSRPTPRELATAFLKPGRGQLVLAIILGLTALLLVVTLRSQAAQPDYSNLRRADLIQLLDNLTAETRRLEAELRELEATRDDLASGVEGSEAARAEAQRRLAQLQIIGGTVPVHGKGIHIVIDDPEHKLTPELLLDALEELRDAGAEVIEFNDTVRVVASTWLALDDRGQIVADGTPLTLPITIDAIGDPSTLEAGARFRGGLVSEVEGVRVGGTVSITQSDRVEIASVVVPRPNEFARPN